MVHDRTVELEVEIRMPTAADSADLAHVHVRGWREAYGGLLPSRFYDDEAFETRRIMWSQLLARDESARRVRTAYTEEEMVGFAFFGSSRDDDSPRSTQLFALYLLAPWYGSGIGQALLDATIGHEPAHLWVARDNPRARRFYEKNGFVPDGEVKVEPDLDGLVEVRMVR